MFSEYASSWKNRLGRDSQMPVVLAPQRRVSHGGIAWSHVPAENLRQPQDGAVQKFDSRSRVEEITSRMQAPQLMEPEDARLTGGTRSLMRRLTGLNVGRKLPEMARKMAPAKARRILANEPQVA